jgi:hypothetical protein
VPEPGGDDLRQLGEVALEMICLVRWSDPDPVTGADVVVVREQLNDRSAGMPGVAAPAAALGLVAHGLPVRARDAQPDDRAFESGARLVGDGGEQVGLEGLALAVAASRSADLLPEVVEGHVVQGGEPGRACQVVTLRT